MTVNMGRRLWGKIRGCCSEYEEDIIAEESEFKWLEKYR
jgi:hypothetical protein